MIANTRIWAIALTAVAISAAAAEVVPTEVQMPGTQPLEVAGFESPTRCNNCHAGYNDEATALAGNGEPQDEPSTGWAGGPMANAGRDPIFWATMAIAEQDFDGSGDLCIRCHSTTGWYGGRSSPTDGSGLAATDSDGVDCDACHLMTSPDNSEHAGIMNSPFIANCTPDPNVPAKNCETESEAFLGSGMLSLWPGQHKLGPYADADARHQFMASKFHRSVDFCGSCHDVSNPVVGDIAANHGAQPGAPEVVSSRDMHGGAPNLGGPVEEKAAFNNPPYAYGTVERTFSEFMASAWPGTMVSTFEALPPELKVAGGSPRVTYEAALLAGNGGDYADGDTRYFSCQSCHMRPVNSAGANKNGLQIRPDLPRHDHTGGNYWLVDMIRYQDSRGQLRLGGNVTATQMAAMEAGRQRAIDHLSQAASLQVQDNTLRVINLTGHKLISGYPEGRRMWLNIKWYGGDGQLIREDGAYGPLIDDEGNPVTVENPAGGPEVHVESILDLHDSNTRVYEAQFAITSDWAQLLIDSGLPHDLVLSYDRLDGDPEMTLGELAQQAPGTWHKTFHFVLNNALVSDNRIPPYGMRYDEARKRNTLPMPLNQYGEPGPGGVYNHWDQLNMAALRPAGAISASIALLYQGTSWEYIQFLEEANHGSNEEQGGNVFLGEEGEKILEAWINAEVSGAIQVAGDRKMVPPVIMATAQWRKMGYTIGGTVSGLVGSGLTLQNNGADDLVIDNNGAFFFSASLAGGESYNVLVAAQPTNPVQACRVENGSGIVSDTDISDVQVLCAAPPGKIFADGFE